MNVSERLTDLTLSLKTGFMIAVSTTGSGIATILEYIPKNLGGLATLVGIVLSCVLIFVHIKRYKMDRKKSDAEHKKILIDKEVSYLEKEKLEIELENMRKDKHN